MQNTRNGLVIASIAALLVACGGGASPSKPVAITPPPPVAETPAPVMTPISVHGTSYANAKEQGFHAITLPKEAEYSDAYAQADFKQNRTLILFASTIKYDVKNPATAKTPSMSRSTAKTTSAPGSRKPT